MALIHYSTTFELLDRHVEAYNSSTSILSSHIRQAMLLTTREIIKIYALSLLKAHQVQPLDVDNLPPLKTNNIQLSKKAKASPRTIQRHLKRLIEAKIILKKVWHGSNSGYDLFLNPKLLFITVNNPVNNAKKPPEATSSKPSRNQSFKKDVVPTCPHTDTSNNSYINNIVIAVDKSENRRTQRQNDADNTGYIFSGYTGKIAPKKNRRTEGQSDADNTGYTFSGYTGKITPKKNSGAGEIAREKRATDHTGAEKSSEDRARSASLSVYVHALWQYARNTIYKSYYLTESQEQSAKAQLQLWYEPVAEHKLAQVHRVYMTRLDMVEKYIRKAPEQRYVQLPDRYFDPKNTSGFTGTKIWYDKQRQRQLDQKKQRILYAEVRRFLSNEQKDTDKQQPRLALFRACETRLGKLKQPELLKAFHASVLNHNTYNFLHTKTVHT